MKKQILIVSIFVGIIASSCQESQTQDATNESTEEMQTELSEETTNEVEKVASVNAEGDTLHLVFDNLEGTVEVNFKDITTELETQKPASGFWYKNDEYELRGKGNDLELKKNDELIFSHKDNIVTHFVTNEEGETLDMTFNNTQNSVKVYLNGGKQIDLEGEKPASGIWYKNDTYELRGKGENLELKKDGEIIFKN